VSWYGSTAGTKLAAPVTTIVSSNAGYLLSTQSGNVFNYNAPYYGSPAAGVDVEFVRASTRLGALTSSAGPEAPEL
jgi:hypothetical protein